MGIPKRLGFLQLLRDLADERTLIDFEETRRFYAQQQVFLQYKNWIHVGDVGAPAFQNSWTNAFSLLGANPSSQVGFFRDRWGFVHLKGTLDNPGMSTANIFTLPTDLRPSKNIHRPGYYSAYIRWVGGWVGLFACSLKIGSDGTVRVTDYRQASDPGYGVMDLTLDNVIFRAGNAGVW